METGATPFHGNGTGGGAMNPSAKRKLYGKVLLDGVPEGGVSALAAGDHGDPHSILGAHPARIDGADGIVLRAFHPDAARVEAVVAGGTHDLECLSSRGLFATFLPGAEFPCHVRLRFSFGDGRAWELHDPYSFLPTVGEVDQHLFNEGTHHRLWTCLGAHARTMDGVDGVAFAVWAPSARRVSVVGEFCAWDGRLLPMRQVGASGVFELFVPGVVHGALYKFELKTGEGALRLKTDPLARWMEHPPATASRVVTSTHTWNDAEWIRNRAERDPLCEPMAVYEVQLGSWMRVPEEGDRVLTYREVAPKLAAHAKRFGFTHVELLPIAEHPYAPSWGYQVSGYYAPTARHGSPDDLRYLIDVCHQHDVGVILDWVPAHFPKDDFALRRFDGTALYEHEDPLLGEHPDWGTLIFNYGRNEVRSFLISNALYWLEEFHADGLRVDAVASMLYLDYSRPAGQWRPNRHGGRENIDAIDFLRAVNEAVRTGHPGCVMIAEESTAWPRVTHAVAEGGLGFTLKWNMGWMHDTLAYFARDPIHRRHHHDALTFAMVYEYTERFLMPLSHDEVVHGKRSLLEKMPGDVWQRFANLRLLLAYQYTRPGKKLLFMGTELAPWREWDYAASLDWHLAEDPMRQGFARFLEALGRLYRESPSLWRCDAMPAGFSWLGCDDAENSVVSYWRSDGVTGLLVVLNLTPVPRERYRVGAPLPGRYTAVLNSDDGAFHGGSFPTRIEIETDPIPIHRLPQSLCLDLPPLAALVLAPPHGPASHPLP
jgi:1,4-alpha-glucan branching enzyme